MRQWNGSTLGQIMACRLYGGLLSIWPSQTNFSEILNKIHFSFTKMHLNISSAKWRPFCPGGDELSNNVIYEGLPAVSSAKTGISWWRHQIETFSASLAICAGNSPVTGEFPEQRPVTRSFDVFFYLHPNKRLSKQSWGWWFETPSCPLWRHCNDPRRTRSIL